MATTDTTIQTDKDGSSYVYLWDSEKQKPVKVTRLLRRQRQRCKCEWTDTVNRGHGKWRRGCLKCGSLGR